MIRMHHAGLSSVLVATAFATSMAVAPAASAAESFNNAEIKLLGGDAAAVSACVNFAKTWAGYDDEKRKKFEKKRVAQANYCSNFAAADGGNVILKDVDFIVFQGGKRKVSKNNASSQPPEGTRSP